MRQMPWKLVGYLANVDDEALTPPNPDTEITIFFAEDDTFGGNGGCNDYNGRYVTDGTSLSLADIVISRQICEQPKGVMEQEAAYMNVLGIVEEYRINERHQLEFIRYITDDKGQRVPKVILMYDPKP
jgi:heat shock protein HslJ